MADDAIHPWPSDPPPKEPLPEVLRRVNTRYGTFRSLNEEALLQDKQALRESQKEAEEGEEVEKSAREKFYEQKNKLAEMIKKAHEEVMYGLDFITLLVTRDMPEQKENLSAGLKDVLPPGSLAFDRWDMNHSSSAASITAADARKQHNVAYGQRLSTIASAVKLLKGAAEQFQTEVDREETYWKDIISIRQRGWKVRRVDPERPPLTLQAGSLEAGFHFRARSRPVLRRKEDGHVQLQGAVDFPARQIRTSLSRSGVLVGRSRLMLGPLSAGLENEILQLRDSLFDEELFYEITREARSLYFRDVILTPSSVSFSTKPLSDRAGYDVVIDLVPLHSGTAAEEKEPAARPLDEQANSINTLFRLLMARAYTRRLQKRTRLPEPITGQPKEATATSILKPLLARLHKLDLSADR